MLLVATALKFLPLLVLSVFSVRDSRIVNSSGALRPSITKLFEDGYAIGIEAFKVEHSQA